MRMRPFRFQQLSNNYTFYKLCLGSTYTKRKITEYSSIHTYILVHNYSQLIFFFLSWAVFLHAFNVLVTENNFILLTSIPAV